MPLAFFVRTATPADADAVTGLLTASYPVLMATAYDEAALAGALPAMTRANPALLTSGSFYVAEQDDGELAGCGGWTPERPGTGETEPGLGHIRHFATGPQWVGRGVGRALYQRCEEAARAAGIRRLECYASLNAEGFYQALGFKTIRRIEVPMGPDAVLPSILMRRDI
ncbi:MAG: GNAT family N-acetyltransferase [Pseudomonadota bacterium]|nr:GNAT family N-acetyltransferase [Pseudomonadota bacterium]